MAPFGGRSEARPVRTAPVRMAPFGVRRSEPFGPFGHKWIDLHREELLANWRAAVNNEPLRPINPLK